MGDWGAGIKMRFFRVLGIGLAFLGILVILFMAVGAIYALTILPKLTTAEGAVKPPIAPAPETAHIGLAMAAIVTVVQPTFYMWLAPTVLEDKGVGASLGSGLKAIKKRGWFFIGFIALSPRPP